MIGAALRQATATSDRIVVVAIDSAGNRISLSSDDRIGLTMDR
jgi:hypothetical protein